MVDLIAQLIVAPQFLGDIALLRPVLNDDRLLVNGRPILDLALEFVDHKTGVGLKVVDHLTRNPTAVTFHKRPRQIIVVECHDRLNTVRQKLVDQVMIELDTRRVDCTRSVGDYARPSNREAVRLEPHLGHERHILTEVMIVVARNIGRSKPTFLVAVLVDDVLLRRLLAILIRSALDLIGARSGAPKEPLRESRGSVCHGCLQ